MSTLQHFTTMMLKIERVDVGEISAPMVGSIRKRMVKIDAHSHDYATSGNIEATPSAKQQVCLLGPMD